MTARGWLGAAAVTVAVVTVGVRLAGFARTLTFAGAVGSTDLGDVYQTANTLPNIVVDLVAGGALTTVVVPLLAGVDRRRAGEIVSALLGWTLAVLIPVAVLVAVFAAPLASVLLGGADPQAVAVGTRMLRVFAVQIPLYGVGMVLTGVLHAHHRFVWPALAPLLSSLTMIGVYLAFAWVEGAGTGLAAVSPAGEAILTLGTTIGVAVLTLCLVPPVRSLGLVASLPAERSFPREDPRPPGLVASLPAERSFPREDPRPSGLGVRLGLRREPALRRRAVNLAGAAAAIVAAQQVVVVLMLRLANGGPDGTVVLWGLAQTVFLVVWAVLALPLSTTVFPRLAELADDRLGFDRLLAGATRAVLLAGGLGVAALVGLAGPLGRLLAGVTATQPPPRSLVLGILAFAPGVLGYGVVALLNRALVAAGGARAAAVAAVVGWGTAAAAAWLLATWLSGADRVPALALANSIGMTVWAAALCSAVARRRGSAARAGCFRTLLVSLLGAVIAGGLGWAVAGMIAGSDSAGWSLLPAIMAGGVVIAVYGVIAAFDRDASAPVAALVSALVRRWGAGRWWGAGLR